MLFSTAGESVVLLGFLKYNYWFITDGVVLLTLKLFVMRLFSRFDWTVDFERFMEGSVVNLKLVNSCGESDLFIVHFSFVYNG